MFGTTDADNLIAACQKYNIPLVWHFGDGSTQSKEPWNWTPDQPFHCGRPRLSPSSQTIGGITESEIPQPAHFFEVPCDPVGVKELRCPAGISKPTAITLSYLARRKTCASPTICPRT